MTQLLLHLFEVWKSSFEMSESDILATDGEREMHNQYNQMRNPAVMLVTFLCVEILLSCYTISEPC